MSGNKLALEVKLKGEKGLEIKFLYWDNRFLSNYQNEDDAEFVYYETDDQNFCLYSHGNGYIIDDGQFALVVPDIQHMERGTILTHEFKNDDVRYLFLKSMYDHLPEWAIKWDRFKNDQYPKHNIVVHNEYWVY